MTGEDDPEHLVHGRESDPMSLDKPDPSDELGKSSGSTLRPAMWQRAAQLYALYGLGVVQTLLAVLGANPNFWVVRRSVPIDVVLFLIVLTGVIPAVLIGTDLIAAKLNDRTGWFVHLGLMAVLASVFLVDLVGTLLGDRTRGVVVITGGMATGMMVVLLYRRYRVVQDLLTLLAIMPVLFTVIFWFRLPPLSGNTAPPVDVGIDDPKTAIVVVLDEFSLPAIQNADGVIDATRFPNFARLSELSTWYPNAVSVHDGTLYSVPAILTGRVPSEGELPIAADHPVNLFTVLASTHEFSVFEDATRLCPQDMCASTREALPPFTRLETLMQDAGIIFLHSLVPMDVLEKFPIPPIGIQWGDFLAAENALLVDDDAGPTEHEYGERSGGERRTVEIGRFIDALGTVPEPALHYLHVDLPHVPYTLLPDGRSYESTGFLNSVNDGPWNANEWLRQQAFARYSASIGFADLAIGDMLDRLESTGMIDDSMLVVVSDHGVAFGDGEPRRLVSELNFGAMANVPLFIKYPGQTAGVVDQLYADLTDVLPSIVSEFGGTMVTDGSALQHAEARPTPAEVTMQSRGGPPITKSWADYEASMIDTRAHIASWVAVGRGHQGLIRSIGPVPWVIGVDAHDFPGEEIPGTVEISGASGGTLPDLGTKSRAIVTAEIRFNEPNGPIAFGLVADGRLVATTMGLPTRDGAVVEFFTDPDLIFESGGQLMVVGIHEGTDSTITIVNFVDT